jgi:hypothetical protein
MTNRAVAAAWGRGSRASAEHFSTNGSDLWSYNLHIGYTDENGVKVLKDYRRQVSVTTSRHCGLAARVAGVIESV